MGKSKTIMVKTPTANPCLPRCKSTVFVANRTRTEVAKEDTIDRVNTLILFIPLETLPSKDMPRQRKKSNGTI